MHVTTWDAEVAGWLAQLRKHPTLRALLVGALSQRREEERLEIGFIRAVVFVALHTDSAGELLHQLVEELWRDSSQLKEAQRAAAGAAAQIQKYARGRLARMYPRAPAASHCGGCLVFGSINMDLRAQMRGSLQDGGVSETDSLLCFPGGHGMNQAVAAARLGIRTALVARVGVDDMGRLLLQRLRDPLNAGLAPEGVASDRQQATGVGVQLIERGGKTGSVVSLGANSFVGEREVAVALKFLDDADATPDADAAGRPPLGAEVVLLQLQVPVEPMVEVASAAKARGCLVALKAAPLSAIGKARVLLDAEVVDLLFADELEAPELLEWPPQQPLCSAADGERAAHQLLSRWPALGAAVISTLSSHVALVRSMGAIAMRGDVSALTSQRWRKVFGKLRAASAFSQVLAAARAPSAEESDDEQLAMRLEEGVAVRVRAIGDVVLEGVVKEVHREVQPSLYVITTPHGELQVPARRVLEVFKANGFGREAPPVDPAPQQQPLQTMRSERMAAPSSPWRRPECSVKLPPAPPPLPTPLCLIVPRVKRPIADGIGTSDAFVGGFIAARCRRLSSAQAIMWGYGAAELSSMTEGAQGSMPVVPELGRFLAREMPAIDVSEILATFGSISSPRRPTVAFSVDPSNERALLDEADSDSCGTPQSPPSRPRSLPPCFLRQNALHLAVLRGSLAQIRWILVSIADIERAMQSGDAFGLTPLQRSFECWRLARTDRSAEVLRLMARARLLFGATGRMEPIELQGGPAAHAEALAEQQRRGEPPLSPTEAEEVFQPARLLNGGSVGEPKEDSGQPMDVDARARGTAGRSWWSLCEAHDEESGAEEEKVSAASPGEVHSDADAGNSPGSAPERKTKALWRRRRVSLLKHTESLFSMFSPRIASEEEIIGDGQWLLGQPLDRALLPENTVALAITMLSTPPPMATSLTPTASLAAARMTSKSFSRSVAAAKRSRRPPSASAPAPSSPVGERPRFRSPPSRGWRRSSHSNDDEVEVRVEEEVWVEAHAASCSLVESSFMPLLASYNATSAAAREDGVAGVDRSVGGVGGGLVQANGAVDVGHDRAGASCSGVDGQARDQPVGDGAGVDGQRVGSGIIHAMLTTACVGGTTLLIAASGAGLPDLVSALLDAAAAGGAADWPLARTRNGYTALHVAVMGEHAAVCALLLRRTTLQVSGTAAKSSEGLTPVDLCTPDFRPVFEDLVHKLRSSYAAFISHYKAESSSHARLVKSELETLFNGRRVFLDSDDLKDLRALEEHVRDSECLVVLLTKLTLTRPYCLIEMLIAVQQQKRLIFLAVDGYKVEEGIEFLRHLDTELEKANPGASDVIRQYGVEMLDAAFMLSVAAQHVIAIKWDTHASRNILKATMMDLLEATRTEIPAFASALAASSTLRQDDAVDGSVDGSCDTGANSIDSAGSPHRRLVSLESGLHKNAWLRERSRRTLIKASGNSTHMLKAYGSK